jgi:membrane associated rhomboid family serine protease
VNFRNPRAINLTPIFVLIAVNILIFIATSIKPSAIDLLGVQRATLSSHPWTIISAMFTHGSIWHILTNMITLYFYGMYVLALVGEVKFFLVYFVGGLVGNALFLLLANPYSIAVGASGAIFALGGALVVLVPRLKIMIFPIPIPMDLWIAILFFALISLQPGIAWQAHLGGLVTGLVAGYIFRVRARRRPS